MRSRRADGVADRVERRVRLGQVVAERRRVSSPAGGRVAVRVPLVAAQQLHGRVLVEQHLAEVDGLDAVDQSLVGLGEQRDPAVGAAPRRSRSPTAAGCGPAAGTRSAPPARGAASMRARSRQRGAAYVVADVEVVVVDPHRVGHVARDRLDPLAVARHERDPVEDQGHEPVVVEPDSAGSKISTVRCAAAWSGSRGRGRRGRADAAVRSSPHPPSSVRVRPSWDSYRGLRTPTHTLRQDREVAHLPTNRSHPVDPPCPRRRRPSPRAPLSLAACGGDDSSGDGQELATKTINVTFSGDDVTPNGDRVEVKVDQPVELVVKADAEGEIHVHSTPEQEYSSTASAPRRCPPSRSTSRASSTVESHALDKTIVQLEVK